MIYEEKPNIFNPRFEVVSCFLEYNDEILLLHRQDHKPEGNTWGVPAGKVDEGEEIYETIVREIREETGFEIPDKEIKHFTKLYVKYPNYDFIYHIYSTKLDKKQEVNINPNEHKNFKWTTPKNALSMNLIEDLDKCIELFYNL